MSKSINQTFLIRHANSGWNAASELNKSNFKKGLISEEVYQQNVLKVFEDPDLCDCPLSQKGVEQCQKLTADQFAPESSSNEENILQLMPNLKYVFVSPLRRTLQTAYLLFKDHKNFKDIKFVMNPLLREQFHCCCDIPDDINIIISEFSPKFPNFDFSLMPRNQDDSLDTLWYVQTLQEPLKTILLSQAKDQKSVLEFVSKNSQMLKLESHTNTKRRADTFKQFLKEHLNQLNKTPVILDELKVLKGDSEFFKLSYQHKLSSLTDDTNPTISCVDQIAVVGHKNLFNFLNATSFISQDFSTLSPNDLQLQKDFYEELPQIVPKDFRRMENCELYHFDSLI